MTPKTPSADLISVMLEIAIEFSITHWQNGIIKLRFKVTPLDRTDTILIAAWKWQQVKYRYEHFIENMNADRDSFR